MEEKDSKEQEMPEEDNGPEDNGPEDNGIDEEGIEFVACDEEGRVLEEGEEEEKTAPEAGAKTELDEVRDEYLRLYAEFDNYKKRAAKDREEISKYANESIMLDLLPSLDHLEIAIKHARESEAPEAPKSGLLQGVDMTLRELLRTLEKFGLSQIEAEGKPFNPEFHHAVSQVETGEMPDGMVVSDMRKGYTYNGKVIRASMVAVSKSPEGGEDETDGESAE